MSEPRNLSSLAIVLIVTREDAGEDDEIFFDNA